jgi:hypothetical protein
MQSEAYGALSSISDKLGEARHAPIDPSLSLRVQGEMYEKLKVMRASAALRSRTYTTAEDAVDDLLMHARFFPGIRSDVRVLRWGTWDGFFSGPFSRGFLLACLVEDYEGMALVQPDLASGVLLDVALDDPMRGDFFETEWW